MTDLDGFRCIYCGVEKPGSERTLEHLWPRRLGGASAPDVFKTRDVCGRCNNNVGLFVDGEFQRSFFMSVAAISAALPFLDPNRRVPLPLAYAGVIPVALDDGEICETWIGPRGERIYHFHMRDDEVRFGTYAGGDPIRRRRRDPGRVYMSFSRPNLFWIETALLSVRTAFPRAPLRLLTRTDVSQIVECCSPEDDQSRSDRAHLAPIWREKQGQSTMQINLDYGKRFQAKLALGLGYNLFGPAFAQLPYEETLRSVLRETDPQRRATLPFIGSSILAPLPPDPVIDRLAYEGAFTFLFNGGRQGVFFTIFTPNRKRLDTQIAPGPLRLPSDLLEQHHGSFVVLVLPGLGQSIGPISMGHYGLHRFGSAAHPVLSQIDARRLTIDEIERRLAGHEIPQTT
ncbi:HNH endonuclease [Hyphomicrobium sp.]|uniref:HNH endonuclease n=1 Tax=Hyphomicrobium sp. TaxID=82 RepID=UPI002FE22A6B